MREYTICDLDINTICDIIEYLSIIDISHLFICNKILWKKGLQINKIKNLKKIFSISFIDAVSDGNFNNIKSLLPYGVNRNDGLIVGLYHPDIVELLLKYGTNVNNVNVN